MQKNRTKLFAYNTVASALQQITLFVVGLIIPRFILGYYGSEINGLVSSITQFVSYITLIEAGISASIVYYLYKPLSDGDVNKIGNIVSAARITYNKLGVVFLVISAFLGGGYMFFASVGSLSQVEILILVISMGVAGALEFFTMARYRVLFTADQRTYVICFATILGSLINTAVTILCCIIGLSIVWVKIIAIFSVYARSIVLSLYYKKHYSNINAYNTPDYTSLDKRWDALYMQVLWSLQSGAPIIIATLFTDMISVSIYTVYNFVIYGVNNLVSIFMSGLQAAFGEIMVSEDKEHLRCTYKQFLFAFYSVLAVIFAITFAMFMPFIEIYTAGLSDAPIYYIPLLGFLFCINGFLFSIKTPQGMMVIAAGMYEETRIQTTIQGLILVVGGVLLTGVFKLGLYGVVIAGILSNGYRAIDFLIYVEKKIVPNSVKQTIGGIGTCAFLIILSCFLSKLLNLPIIGVWGWVIKCCLIGIVSGIVVVLIAFIFQRSSFNSIVKRIKALLKNWADERVK